MMSGSVGEQSDGARGGRREPAWRSLWYVVENQAHNAFNDKVAQFILLAVSEVVAARRTFQLRVGLAVRMTSMPRVVRSRLTH
jgi:hypothetical protein